MNVKNLLKKFFHTLKLLEMDRWWYLMGGNCFGLFPPSFYHSHSEEEIKRLTDEAIMEIKKLLKETKTEEAIENCKNLPKKN